VGGQVVDVPVRHVLDALLRRRRRAVRGRAIQYAAAHTTRIPHTPRTPRLTRRYSSPPRAEGDSRTRGRQFTVNKQKSGITGDNWNRGKRTDFRRLFEGEDLGVDPNTYERKWKMEEKKKNLTPEGFRFPSFPQKSSGLGSYYGTIGPKLKNEPEYEVQQKGARPGRVVHEKPQMVCNPPKKGYGSTTPGLIFGPGPKKGEKAQIGKEYKNEPDPYDRPREFEKAERLHLQKMLDGRAPYRTMGHAVDFFDAEAHVAASRIYREEPRMPEKVPPPEPEPVSLKPFKPGGPKREWYATGMPKSGYPEYMPDPEEYRHEKHTAALKKLREEALTPFKPPSKPKKLVMGTESIMFKTAGRAAGK